MTSVNGGLPRALVLLVAVAAAVVTLAGVKATAWLLAPALLALVIVITTAPVHRWLRARRVPSWAATAALLIVIYAIIAAFGLTVIVSVARLTTLLPEYTGRFNELLSGVTDELARLGVGPGQIRGMAQSLDFGKLLTYLGSFLTGLTGVVTNLVFLLALLLFLGVETNGFEDRMAAVAATRPKAGVALGEFARRTRRYIAVTTIFGLIVAVLDTVALLLVGVPLALLWGLLSFVTNYIPNLGFVLGLIPPALLALLDGGWQRMLVVIALYCVLNFVVQSLIQPYYVGDAVGLSPVITFLALVFWTWILGPLGAILAIPMTLLAKTTLIDADPDAGWLSTLLHLSSADSARKSPRARPKRSRRRSPRKPGSSS